MNAPAGTVNAMLQQALAAQQRGDLATAEPLLRAVLDALPEQPDALQLLGLVARRRGDAVAAEAWMRRSLAVREAQPNVWNNLGNVLGSQGRFDEAEACYRRAVALAPRYADGWFNLARREHAKGDAAAARASLDRAVAAAGGSPTVGMRQLRALLLGDAGQLAEAEAEIRRAIAEDGSRASLHHELAVLLQRRHQPAASLAAHDQARALGLDAADAHYNRGNTLQSLGRLEDAARAYRDALARQPGHALALLDLARLRWRNGDPDFDAELCAHEAAEPASPMGPGLRGHLLWRAGRVAEAAQAFGEAVRRAPQGARWHDGLGRCLVQLGEVEAGLRAHEQALALAPGDAEHEANHLRSLLVARRPDRAARGAEAASARHPHDQQLLALLALAWRLTGDARAAWLDRPADFVRVVDLPPPAGHASIEAFCAELAAELEPLHRDREAPIDQTLRHGTQTVGNLFEQGHPRVRALESRIAEAVQACIESLPDEPDHPFLRRAAEARRGWRFTDSWSSRLCSSGFHTDHVHPHGWLSSACYIALPPSVREAAEPASRQAAAPGWLRFGVPDFDCGLAEPVQRVVAPKVGRLVLFPSMAWHGTWPFDDSAGGHRLTVAFDVVPGARV